MLISRKELEKFVDIADLSNEELKEAFTSLAYEVESIFPLNYAKNTKFGKVIECKRHPNAEKLSLCKVETEKKIYNVVCGALNVKANQIISHAIPKSIVNNIELKEKELRGIKSFGMILSISELGGFDKKIIEESEKENIFAFNENNIDFDFKNDPTFSLGLNDYIFDLSILPDRFYALNYKTLAIELGAYLNKKNFNIICPSNLEIKKINNDEKIDLTLGKNAVNLTAFNAKLTNKGKTPWYIKRLLYVHNIQVKNTIEDIINYVKLYKGSTGYILERTNKIILDGRKLNNIDIFKDSPIKNKNNNEVTFVSISSNETSAILKEKEIYGIFGELNLKGTGYINCKLGTLINLAYQSGYIESIGQKFVVNSNIYKNKKINVSDDEIFNFIGQKFDLTKIEKKLNKIKIFKLDNDSWSIPEYRIDLESKQDLIEEIVRFFGINNIKSKIFPITREFILQEKHKEARKKILNFLIKYGFFETKTYHLLSKNDAKNFNIFNNNDFISLDKNYTNKLNTLRTSLLKSLIDVHVYNYRKEKDDLRFFELSNVFVTKKDFNYNLGLIHDSKINEKEPIVATKEILISILKLFNINKKDIKIKKTNNKEGNIFNYYNSAEIFYNNELIAIIGEIHPKILRDFKYIRIDKIKEKLYYFELKINKILR